MRALIVTNMYPQPARPALGSFVRDQVEALRRTGAVDLDLFAFEPGGYVKAASRLRHKRGYDIVHAHFGLTLWPALAASGRKRAVTLHGTDLAHPRSRAITLAGLRAMDLVCAVSQPLADGIPRWAAKRPPKVIPVGVEMRRFKPIPRLEAREALGLDPEGPYILFPAATNRPEKRFDRAQQLAAHAKLLTLGNAEPEQVPLWFNAANAVLVPSEREGFGLATLEALACNVPVLSTPVGIAPEVLTAVQGTLCAPFDSDIWSEALRARLGEKDPRIEGGRQIAERYSTDAMAAKLLEAWRALL
jgi:teichuronic acid biosynthesis glycosyltransferase TuaC